MRWEEGLFGVQLILLLYTRQGVVFSKGHRGERSGGSVTNHHIIKEERAQPTSQRADRYCKRDTRRQVLEQRPNFKEIKLLNVKQQSSFFPTLRLPNIQTSRARLNTPMLLPNITAMINRFKEIFSSIKKKIQAPASLDLLHGMLTVCSCMAGRLGCVTASEVLFESTVGFKSLFRRLDGSTESVGI